MSPLLLLLFLLIFAPPLWADAAFESWLEAHQASFSFDPVLGTGTIRKGSHTYAFLPGQHWLIVDGIRKKNASTPLLDNNVLVTTPKMLDELSLLVDPVKKSQGQAKGKITTIFIDPGHGGKDPGSIGHMPNGKASKQLREKDVVLQTALLLRDILAKRYPDKRIVLSRSTDEYLSLEDRTKRANALARSMDQSVLYVSVHANASLNPKAKGYEVWYLPRAYRRQIVKAGDVKVDQSIRPIINDIVEESLTRESIMLGQNILHGMDGQIGNRTPSRGLKEEEWYVVRNSFMPSVLVEVGFVTNPEEFELLQDNAYLQSMVSGIYSGMVSFIQGFETEH